jgi:hypothetical protein
MTQESPTIIPAAPGWRQAVLKLYIKEAVVDVQWIPIAGFAIAPDVDSLVAEPVLPVSVPDGHPSFRRAAIMDPTGVMIFNDDIYDSTEEWLDCFCEGEGAPYKLLGEYGVPKPSPAAEPFSPAAFRPAAKKPAAKKPAANKPAQPLRASR